MIKKQTILKVADNSGAKKVKCIHLGKGFNKKSSYLGDLAPLNTMQNIYEKELTTLAS